MRYKPPSIEDVGLREHLTKTAESHNGFGYIDFCRLVEGEVNISNLARAFNVSQATIRKWLEVYGKERGNETAK